ncbi:MAG: hypothetical protein ACLQVI_14190 [Polyangiaceae bacterium]
MKGRHRGDLVWRFHMAEEEIGRVRGDLGELLEARDRVKQIDARLKTLRTRPISLARVLSRHYGAAEAPAQIRRVLHVHAAIATMTDEAAACFARTVGEAPRPRAIAVRRWLMALCRRIEAREASGEDTVAIDEVRRGAERLLIEAESAYEAAAEVALAG